MKKKVIHSNGHIVKFFCLAFLFILIILYSNVNLEATNVSYDTPSYSSLTPHDPIIISSDLDFVFFPGDGLKESPYIIEGYNITTAANYGIHISGTNAYFIIRNCYIDAVFDGIFIDFKISTDGVALITNNTCQNSYRGIFLMQSLNNIVTNNSCSNNLLYGILTLNSQGSTITNNICQYNGEEGIHLQDTAIVENNICNNNGKNGIFITGTANCVNNTCNNNGNNGILLWASGVTIFNNTCNYNNYGINLDESSDNCAITYNLLQENSEYGASIISGSNNNIHHNTFVNNNLGGSYQALDNGTNNNWYEVTAEEGNFWSEWLNTEPYIIDGSAGTFDLYPLLNEPFIEFDSPIITNIIHSPFNPTVIDAVILSAKVTDYSGVLFVSLHYRINTGTWQVVNMSLVSEHVYNVSIGTFAFNDIIEYYISAVDACVTNNEAVNDNSGLFYSFTIYEVIQEFQKLSIILISQITIVSITAIFIKQTRKTT